MSLAMLIRPYSLMLLAFLSAASAIPFRLLRAIRRSSGYGIPLPHQPTLQTIQEPIGPDTPDAEVWALLLENIDDLARWENEGGSLSGHD